jgi:hypothetical protein
MITYCPLIRIAKRFEAMESHVDFGEISPKLGEKLEEVALEGIWTTYYQAFKMSFPISK